MKVIPTENFELYLQWNDEKVYGEYFTLLKSTSPEENFEPILTMSKKGSFLDKNVNLYEIGRNYYYILEIMNEEKKVIDRVGPVRAEYSTTEKNGIARAIIREYGIVLRVMDNPKYKLLLKKRTGMHCPDCYNPITKRVKFADCKRCNGTGLIHGYHSAVDVLISRDFSREVEYSSMLDEERVKETPVNAWMLPYPRVSIGDLFVDPLNRRYRVKGVSPRTQSHVLIRQILELTPLEKGHPAYNKEVGDLIE